MNTALLSIRREVSGLQPWLSRIWDFVACDRLVMPFGRLRVTATMWHAWVPQIDETGRVRFRQANTAAELIVELPDTWKQQVTKRRVEIVPGLALSWTGDINPKIRPTSDCITVSWPQATVHAEIDGWPDPQIRDVYLTRDSVQIMASKFGMTASAMLLARE